MNSPLKTKENNEKQKSIFSDARDILQQLIESINALTFSEYTEKLDVLSGGTIGEHTRHVIELFQQLNKGYQQGLVNYDDRKRDIRLEEDIDFAIENIAIIISELSKEDKALLLHTLYQGGSGSITSNYLRELLYNIEHCIHHQAIVKIGLLSLKKSIPNKNFGIAKSTILYRAKCAQ